MQENFEIIDTDLKLKDFCNEVLLLMPKYLAIDTEFTRRKAEFYPKLSLVQLCFNDRLFIIDCLSKDISCFSPIDLVFQNKKIVKLFFDYSQDITALASIAKFVPRPIIDVQTYAMFLENYSNNISYLFLLQKYLDIRISKSEKNSNWGMRPLSDHQLDYAVIDVKYLVQLYNVIEENLINSKKLQFAENESILLCDIYKKKGNAQNNKSFLNKIFFCLKENCQTLSQIENYILSKQIENYILSPECIDQLSIIKSIVDKNSLDMPSVHTLIDTEFEDILFHNRRFEQKKGNEIYNFISLYIQHKCIANNVSYKIAIGKKHYLNNLINYNSVINPIANGWRKSFFGRELLSFLKGNKPLSVSLKIQNDNLLF